MTHTVDINMCDRFDLWRGNTWMWMTKDLMLIEQFEPMVWLTNNAEAAWCWNIVDVKAGDYVFDKYRDRLGLFDDVSTLRLRLTFDSLDDALLFKLTWV